LHTSVGPLIGGPLAGFSEPSPADLPPFARRLIDSLLNSGWLAIWAA